MLSFSFNILVLTFFDLKKIFVVVRFCFILHKKIVNSFDGKNLKLAFYDSNLHLKVLKKVNMVVNMFTNTNYTVLTSCRFCDFRY